MRRKTEERNKEASRRREDKARYTDSGEASL